MKPQGLNAYPAPIGSRVPSDGRSPRDFVFVIDRPPPREGLRWVPLAEALQNDWVWGTYVDCILGGWEPPTRALAVFFFGDAPEMASRLAHLVTCGAKRGTTCWVGALDEPGTTVPHAGLVSVVTDGYGLPRCVIHTDDVRTLRFAEVTATDAALEGEGDMTLADWHRAHLPFFHREAAGLGRRFDENELVMFERFRVLHVIGRKDEPEMAG